MPIPIDDETLVAYLDGELPSDQAVAVEQSLNYDNSLRERLDLLRNTWDLLSELPDVAPRKDLAQSTIEILTLELEEETQGTWRWLAKHKWWTLSAACLLMLLCGVLAGRTATKLSTNRLLGELPTIVEYASLSNIDSVEWLERLANLKNLVEAMDGGGPKRIGVSTVPVDIGQRAHWIESLDETDRGRLADNYEAYSQQTAQRQNHLHLIADKIFADEDDAKQLLQVVHAYYALLDLAGSKQATTLKQMPMDKRLREVEQRVARAMVNLYASKMSDVDRQAVLEWLEQIQWDERHREEYDRSFDPDQRVISELFLDATESIVSVDDTDEVMRNGLSKYARDLLQAIVNEDERRLCIGMWVLAATGPPGSTAPVVSAARMEARLAELPNDEQDRLDFMPESEARKELKKQLGAPDTPLTQP